MQPEQQSKLTDLPDELAQLARRDGTIYAFVAQFRKGLLSYNELLLMLVLQLAAEKRHYFEEILGGNISELPPISVPGPLNLKVIDNAPQKEA